jgi:hypothetical protein
MQHTQASPQHAPFDTTAYAHNLANPASTTLLGDCYLLSTVQQQ